MSKLIECKICGKEYKNLKAISSHIRVHNITSYEYYEKFLKKENDGVCLNFGKVDICEKETSWINMVIGYHRFCSEKCMVRSEYFRKISSESKLGNKHWLKRFGVVHPNKDKTYEEIHGEEKTKKLKDNLSKLGKTLTGKKNPFYNHHHTKEACEIFRNNKLGKTYEQMYGEEKGKELRKSKEKPRRENHKKWYTSYYLEYGKEFLNKQLREKIKKDQNFKCGNCKNDIIKYRSANLHHINYKKLDCRRENLIFLCSSCHGRTNKRTDQKIWQEKLITINNLIILESERKV